MYKILNRTHAQLPTEEEEQKGLIKYLRDSNMFHYANVNENKQSFANRTVALKIEAKSKAMGKLKGVSDLTIFLKDQILFIELKRQKPLLKNKTLGTPKNKPTKEQLEFIEKTNTFIYCKSFVAYGCNEAIKIIQGTQKI